MLHVECESCNAPYQIDERRVPPTGLKMRCPKCGHSFVVQNPVTSLRASSGPPTPSSALQSVPSDFPAALGSLDEPDLPIIPADLPATKSQVADLPAAKKTPPRPGSRVPAAASKPAPPVHATRPGSSGDFGLDLPVVPANLPMAKGPPPKPPLPTSLRSKSQDPPSRFDLDLPAAAPADLPAPRRVGEVDLPVISAELPVVAASLPTVAAGLPSPAASLPSPVGILPVVSGRGFGEIDLPSTAEVLPSPAATLPAPAQALPSPAATLPSPAEVLPNAVVSEQRLASRPPGQRVLSRPPESSSAGVSFGEIDLPREPPILPPEPPPTTGVAPGVSSADFEDLMLDDKPRSRGHVSARPPTPHGDSTRGGGGMTFGEVDFAPAQSDAGAAIGIDEPHPAPPPGPTEVRVSPSAAPAATAPVRVVERVPVRVRPAVRAAKRRIGKSLLQVLLVAAILAGAALQLTPYGAYGYHFIGDLAYAKEYERATLANVGATEKALAIDTYDQAKAAIDAVAAAHARLPRAKALTAYAAMVDGATTVRFGQDNARASRSKQLLKELPPDERSFYHDIALAVQAAADGELDKARKGLTAASGRNAEDPIQVEVALLLGDVALAAKDGPSALAAFRRAQQLSNDARAHFGLARAYDATRDAANAKIEIDNTLVLSPQHPGALTLRARMKSAPTDEAQALRDLAVVLEGAARAKASPAEASRAYSARAWVSLERGSPSEARDWFAKAVSLDPRNTLALSGEGRLLLSEGRYTEALSRFDTALQVEPDSPDAIADDAEAKLALERLADAKKQLVDARQRFPRSVSIVSLLGRVEQHLGNNDVAEADMRSAVAMVDATQRDAVLPYVALSELLSARGKLLEAKAVLDEAKKKLPASAALDRALGEVADLQGEHETAIAYYRGAIAKDPRDLAARFHLAVTLRRVRKFADAEGELDRVAAVDKDYPGLSLERGLLFEESGDVQKAIEQFKAALSRAPDDPDLQLRVGSAYVAIGRPDDAIPMLRKVLHGRPTSAEAHHYLGRALMLKGPSQQAEALRYLKRAVDLDPNRAEFHVYLAWAANEATPAQLELARDEIDRALTLDKLNAESYWQKGVLERMQGSIEDAIKDERHALELRPSRYEAHATLAECYEDRNDEATSMAEWAKAVAGDGQALPEGGVRHPYWRYKYGKLLMMRGSAPAAAALLVPAATTVEKSDQRPGWLAPLEFLTGEALRKVGRKAEAVEHYRRFMDLAPVTSPDRGDAQEQLKRLTGQ
jgi:predicted Zn finger-like uncharacterized protein